MKIMKSFFVICCMLFTSTVFASNSGTTSINNSTSIERSDCGAPVLKVNGRNGGTTITNNPNGTKVIEIDCDSFFEETCFTVELDAGVTVETGNEMIVDDNAVDFVHDISGFTHVITTIH